MTKATNVVLLIGIETPSRGPWKLGASPTYPRNQEAKPSSPRHVSTDVSGQR
jgi:hypothetical protein